MTGDDQRLVDSWRASASTLDHAMTFVRQHMRTIANPDASFKDAAYARFMLPKLTVQYHDALRRVSEAQAEMDRRGIQYSTERV